MRSAVHRWTPATLVVVLAAVLVHVGASVGWRDIAAFGGYVVGWLVLPGTLIWRVVDRRATQRTLFADLAIGSLVGYIVEFPVYLACLAVGSPHLYVLWPLVVVLATVTHPAGRRLWTQPTVPTPMWWSWSVAAMMAYVAFWFVHHVWGPSPVTPAALRMPYIDETFHLSLVSELRHHVRPEDPFVAGQPLYYHWLSHLHMAAASWVTGADPIVLLRALSLPMAFALCGLGAAAIAVRITGAPWVGVVALGLQLLGPLDFSGWRYDGEGPLDVRLLNSPSAGFANAALLVGILLSVEIIRGRMRGWLPYAAAVLAFIAMFGAKSTSLPTVMAGLLGVVVFTLVSQRRLDRSAGVLFILSVLVFVLVKPFFFGSGSRGLAVDVFGLFGEHSIAVGAVGATVRLLTYWVLGLPLVLMLLRRSGRTPESVLLLCLAASGFAAALAMHQSGFSEWYFAWGVLVPMTLGSAIGIEHVVRGLREDVPETWGRILGLFGWVALGSVIVAQTYVAVMPDDATFTLPATFGAAIRTELLPLVVTLLIAAVLVLGSLLLIGHREHAPVRYLFRGTLVAVVLGMSAQVVTSAVGATVADPIPRAAIGSGEQLIGSGGLAAAAWLQRHSGVDDLIATNAHCELPGVYPCSTRNFWISAYTERRVLVEGWSYVQDDPTVSFWQPAKLAANDAAFADPSVATVRRLRHHYGVRWLLLDRRYPSKVHALSNVLSPVYRHGAYLVFDLDRLG